LEERGGRFTGRLVEAPLVGEARGAWLREHARERGADLRRAHAYADSLSDLSLLDAVGHPTAVNPEVRLDRLARKRRWPVAEWRSEEPSFAGSLLERLAGAR
jgi:alcohol-forming fatty acyl-CoA reductase